MENRDWTIIPDIHGRRFWRSAVSGHEEENIVFLGDYLDPYSWEEITPGDATRELKAVIDFKKEHMDNVVLLLGNHDLGYLDSSVCCSRHDGFGEARNRRMLEENLELFDLVHEADTCAGKVIFSHSGLCEGWVKANDWIFDPATFRPAVLNNMLHCSVPGLREDLMLALGQVSFHRGGYDPVGSVVWADLDEIDGRNDLLKGYLHIFGHTIRMDGYPRKVGSGPAVGWCLDCARAFRLNSGGEIEDIKYEKTQK